MKCVNHIFILFCFYAQSQYKDGIAIVQASAEFVKESNLEIKRIKDAKAFNYDISKDSDFFSAYKVEFIPTIILFNNGDEVYRWEADIMLKLKCELKDVQKEIDKLIEDKF